MNKQEKKILKELNEVLKKYRLKVVNWGNNSVGNILLVVKRK